METSLTLQPSLPRFKELACEGNLVPLTAELMADTATPLSLYQRLREERPAFLFESISGGEHLSRYSFLGSGPRRIFEVFEQETRIREKSGETRTVATPADPLELIEQELAGCKPVELPGLPRFTGGALGFIGYEYVHRIEPTVPRPEDDQLGTPLLYFLITDSVVTFDHARQVIQIIVNAHLDEHPSPEEAYAAASAEVQRIAGLLQTPRRAAPPPMVEPEAMELPESGVSREEFEACVERTREYIRAGDIIQAVVSQRFKQPFERDPLLLYRALRVVNPSPYMFCLETGDFSLVGASPEVHVRLTGDRVEIRPIAGTRPRGLTEAEDRAHEADLLADEKERAEHLMLVDLARNDIGRVCSIGSICWPEYMIVERYSHVMHIVSQVEGRLAAGQSGFDLMRATFPAGTVSGAPKIRAMQIIAELEKTARGPYAGAVGYFGFNGNVDSCIAIRTALHRDGILHIQSGAGLVADSVPASEYQETVNKAKGMLKAVALALAMPE